MSVSDLSPVGPMAAASQWLVRLRDEPDNEALFNEWLLWREADPENSTAYDRIRSLWHQFDQVRPEYPGIEDESGGSSNSAQRPGVFTPQRKWSVGAAALAASCAAVACALWFVTRRYIPAPMPAVAHENRSSILPDGSAVDLGAQTSVAVDFTDRQRLLRLSQGEAFFKVKKDVLRPFTVRAGSVDVVAVGTAFDVNRQSDRIVVTVQEGMVAVKPSAGASGSGVAPWRVAAGYQFIYSEQNATATLSSVDTSAMLAWREGRLEYTRVPLSAVVIDINRYAEHPITLADAEVGNLTFTGTVFTNSISDWVSALPGALPVKVQHGEGGTVLLRASGDASPGP